MFENIALKIIFGRKREDVRGRTEETAQPEVMYASFIAQFVLLGQANRTGQGGRGILCT